MGNTKQERLKLILHAINGMSESEWKYIASVIDHVYNAKAAKVVLDGSDTELVLRIIKGMRESYRPCKR